jgi:hypothetical protein
MRWCWHRKLGRTVVYFVCVWYVCVRVCMGMGVLKVEV